MKIMRYLNRKLILAVAAPVLRAASSAAIGYLTSKGIPAETVGQLLDAVALAAMLGFNVAWELVDRNRAVNKAVADVR